MSKFKEHIKKIPFFAIISFVMLLLYGVSLFLPLLWAIITSFKTNFNYLLDSFGWPTEFVNNYVTVLKYFTVPIKDSTGSIYYVGITEMVVNSIWYALGSALLSTTAAFLVGYVVARFRFKFCHIIYTVIIIQMIVPTVGTLPSELRIAHALGLYDTVFGALFMKTYVSGLYLPISDSRLSDPKPTKEFSTTENLLFSKNSSCSNLLFQSLLESISSKATKSKCESFPSSAVNVLTVPAATLRG